MHPILPLTYTKGLSGASWNELVCRSARAGAYHAVARSSLGPDQQKHFLAVRHTLDDADNITRRGCGLAVHLQNHISRLQACIFCGTSRAYLCNGSALHVVRYVHLLPHIGGQITHGQAELTSVVLCSTAISIIARYLCILLVFAQRYVHRLRCAVSQNAKVGMGSWCHLCHVHLQSTTALYRTSVQGGDNITVLETRIGRRRTR